MTDDTPHEDPYPDSKHATSAMLKAYAHPLRRRIAKVLVGRTYARAADIAAELDLPANGVSFHLRVLANAGLIEEAPERARDRRDRVWTAVEGAWSIGSPARPVEDEMLGGALMSALAEDHFDMVRRVLEWVPEYVTGRDPEPHGTFSQHNLRLNSAEYAAMEKRIHEAIKEVTDAHDADDPDTRTWTLDIIGADDMI
ncbi:winged helix-turn-helix domain-containing protein [Microbacterium sp. A84]|uniref:winged helix-turn-helix domain-containing protein n=1 Tax=Microbacterium sp. A84 TaxID=3450715 RepID=UPI003F426BCD